MTGPKRKVLMYTPEPGSGAGTYVSELVCGLAEAGAPVKLFCPANFYHAKEVRACGVEMIFAPQREIHQASFARRIYRNLVFVLQSAGGLRRSSRAGDIVHFQFPPHLWVGVFLLLMVRWKGAGVVLTVHDPLPHRWLLPGFLRLLEEGMIRFAYSLCDRLIVHNESGAEVLRERFHCRPETIVRIPHGPMNLPKKTEPEITGARDSGPLRLLSFGSIRRNKGLDLSILAVQELCRRNAGSVSLTIAGAPLNDDDQAYWKYCRGLIDKDLGAIEVQDRSIPDEEIGPLFARHDASLLAYTLFSSESGVAAVSLSCGRPLIATRSGGFGELLRDAGCGIAIETFDTASLAAAVEQALRLSPAELHAKGQAGPPLPP